ncbi:hypothetical protein [Pantoea agglomerans]|uniref:hypothetical protein n=1 Tax=Enterobacter agglomerans TaxID=549 RepID=UPI003209CBF1
MKKGFHIFEDRDYDKEKRRILNRNSTTCCMNGCSEKSIYSHIISKSLSIEKISQDQHVTVFNPSRHADVKIPKFASVGINDNPAFNGFCKKHDDLFQLIDSFKIKDFFGVYLQLFRTISSEIYFLKMGDILYPDIDIAKGVDFIVESLKGEVEKDDGSINIERFEKVKVDLALYLEASNDDKKLELEEQIKHLTTIQDFILDKIKTAEDELTSLFIEENKLCVLEVKEIEHQVFAYITNFKIPLAISTMHTFPGIEDDANNSYAFYVVVPYEDSNIIIGLVSDLTAPQFIDRITKAVNCAVLDELAVLNFVEALAMASPDNTYYCPSVIDEMSNEKLRIFTEDCMCLHEFQNSCKYLAEYDMSIFDSLRRKIIDNSFPDQEHELQKISNLPVRKSYEVRYQKLFDKIMKENLVLNNLKSD